MTEPATRSPSPGGGFRRALRWWAVTGAFLVGLLVGVLVTGLLSDGGGLPPTAGGAATPTRSEDSPPATADPTEAEATGEVVVNGACLRALNAAEDMLDVVQDLGQALSEFNAARLDEIVRRLQPLERRLGENAEECEVQGRVPTGAGSTGGTSPSPSAPSTAPSTE